MCSSEFKKKLLDSMPFHESDVFSALGENSPPERARRAAELIVSRGLADLSELVSLVSNSSEDAWLRIESMRFLAWSKYQSATRNLIEVAKNESEDVKVRYSALVNFVFLGGEEFFEDWKFLVFHDPLPRIRYAAVSAFATSPSKGMFDALFNVVRTDADCDVRCEALRLIGGYNQYGKECPRNGTNIKKGPV